MAKTTNKFLRLMGIVLVLLSLVGFLLGIIWYSDAAEFADDAADSALLMTQGVDVAKVATALLVCSLGALVGFIAGILGIVFASKPGKAMVCVILGGLALLLTVIGLIISGSAGGDEIVSGTFFIVTGCAGPAIYAVAAFLGKGKDAA